MRYAGALLSPTFLLLSFTPAVADQANGGEARDAWSFQVKPVLWNPAISLRLSDSDDDDDDENSRPDYCFFCLDKLSNYLALQAEARRSRFAVLFDGLRVRFEDTLVDGRVNLNIASTLGFVELAAAYQHREDIPLDAYVGVRYTFVENEIWFPRLPAVEKDYDWVDPVIGARYTYTINRDWSMLLRGDIGGFGVSTDWMTNASVDAVYRVNGLLSLSAGYRYLDIKFEDDDFLYDANLRGLQVAAAFSFQ
jgi:hypothetical protein